MYKLILGDALQLIDEIEDESIDCVITDPPYGIKYNSKQHSKFRDTVDWDDSCLYTQQLHEKIMRKLKKTGCAYVFCSWKNYKIMPTPDNLLVWCKNNNGMGDCFNYGNSHEFICFYKKPNFRLKTIKRPFNYFINNVITYNQMIHPTEKPVELLEKLVVYSTKQQDTILDLFVGSGSTGVATIKHNRNFIGFEINKDYYEIALKRLEEQAKQQKITLFI